MKVHKIAGKAIIILLVLFMHVFLHAQETDFLQSNKGYSSWLPAPSADHAMLLGNGTMGGMVFGHPHNETIIMNHSALYLPNGMPKKPIDQKSRLAEIRQLIREGKGVEAARIPVEISKEEGYEEQEWSDPYVPAFDIKIDVSSANIREYKRYLNFETGEAIVRCLQEDNEIIRRQFISRTDSIMIIHIKGKDPFDVDFRFDRRPVQWDQWEFIQDNIKDTEFYAEKDQLYYKSEFIHQWEGNIAGYEGLGKVIPVDGILTSEGNTIKVKNTTETFLLVGIETHNKGESLEKDAIEAKLNRIHPDYNQLRDAQKKVHTEMFNRVKLDLQGKEQDRSLDTEIMMQEAKQRLSNTFVEKQFYASRYNILSATGSNPPNLQGIWGSSWQPPWSSDYTHDGNLPVAISSFLSSNMPELMHAFFDYHDALIPHYRDNAEKLYGCRGIQIPSHTSSHGWNVHFDPTWCLTFWNGGAAWTASFYYDYWLYTNDKDFLAQRAYPFMKETALFYEDFLIPDKNGKYMFNPSYSPENNPGNHESQATINATMDVMLAKELFRNLISAGELLNEDQALIRKWEQILTRLPEYEVNEEGELREWIWPGYEENHEHRHLSHLYGMYDMVDPEIARDSTLIKGVGKVVEERMKVRRRDNGGIMVFGMVQLAWVAANLGDAEMVEEILHWLSAQYWSNSLATYHDPNGLFNMDLSGGFQTVIIRALLYSEPGYIALLPAKPPSWKEGSISGLLARNEITVEELQWDTDRTRVTLSTPKEQEITLKLPGDAEKITATQKSTSIKSYNPVSQKAIVVLEAGKKIQLVIHNKINQ